MPQESGRLVFISSGALAGIASQPSYSTAKAGILGFTWSCASALFPYGITTNCVVPSAATRMSDKTFSDYIPLSDEVGETVRSDTGRRVLPGPGEHRARGRLPPE